MATTNITYVTKTLGAANPLPEDKKLTYQNVNEIKDVVNNNATELDSTNVLVATNTTDISTNTSALTGKADLTGAVFTGSITSPDFIGDLNGSVRFTAKAAQALTKGQVVAITGVSGFDTVVDLADADNVASRPAFGLVWASVSINQPVEIVTFGNLEGLDTSAFTEGDTLYLSTVAGEYTATAPAGEAADIQNIGKVIRSQNGTGIVKVMGSGRANATPNLDSGKMFLGNSANQSVSVAMSGDVTISDTGVTTVGTIDSVPVSTITSDISTNSSGIATNLSNIGTNATDIATNAGGVSTNSGNISTNTTEIATNVTAISNRIEKNVGTTYTTNALTTVTQAEYDALTPDSATIYFII